MKIYDMQDRSLSDGTKSNINPPVDTNLSLDKVTDMVDLSDDQIDTIMDMDVGEEAVFDGWIWVQRTA